MEFGCINCVVGGFKEKVASMCCGEVSSEGATNDSDVGAVDTQFGRIIEVVSNGALND